MSQPTLPCKPSRPEERSLENRAKFVALSQFTVANGTNEPGEANPMTGRVKQAFLDRPHLVDGAPGFVRMEVISPDRRSG